MHIGCLSIPSQFIFQFMEGLSLCAQTSHFEMAQRILIWDSDRRPTSIIIEPHLTTYDREHGKDFLQMVFHHGISYQIIKHWKGYISLLIMDHLLTNWYLLWAQFFTKCLNSFFLRFFLHVLDSVSKFIINLMWMQMMWWRIQHCQNHYFKAICPGNENLMLGPLEKIGAPLNTSWKLKYKLPRRLVKLWMCLSQNRQQRYSAWHLPEKSNLRYIIWVIGLWIWQAVTLCDILSKGGPKTCSTLE